jgi:hypothetical protein
MSPPHCNFEASTDPLRQGLAAQLVRLSAPSSAFIARWGGRAEGVRPLPQRASAC